MEANDDSEADVSNENRASDISSQKNQPFGMASGNDERSALAAEPRVGNNGSKKRPASVQVSSSSSLEYGRSPERPGSSKSGSNESSSTAQSKSSSTSASSASSQNDEGEGREKLSKRPKGGKPKKDRSTLRKGKWTVEEEEYTSRIIHYFSNGLLTMPEGATLRSYLADKLNCDAMRITKKYAGASCLGRRFYHFRDRVHPTVAEIQVAKAELDHLEQRFRMRIEGRQTPGAPLLFATPTDLVQVLARQAAVAAAAANPMMQLHQQLTSPLQAQNMLQTLLLGLGAAQNANALLATAAPQQAAVPVAASPFGFPILQAPPPPPVVTAATAGLPALPPNLAQLLLPSVTAEISLGGLQNTVPVAPQLQGVNANNIANWTFSQAAASLGPALSQLAAANIQQAHQAQLQQLQQQQQAQMESQRQQAQQQQAQLQLQQQAQLQQQLQAQQLLEQQKAELQARIQEQQAQVQLQLLQLKSQQQAQVQPPVAPQLLITPQASQIQQVVSGEDQAKAFAAELKQAYLKSLGFQALQENVAVAEKPTISLGSGSIKSGESAPISSYGSLTNAQTLESRPLPVAEHERPRTEEDKEGGTALLGFLSSLRKSYEDVLREKQLFEGGKSESSYDPVTNHATTVTDSNSSQQRDSSVEDSDWNSDKKTDPSSSEDSDKEVNDRCKKKRNRSKGPPRKRMKFLKMADEMRKGPAS